MFWAQTFLEPTFENGNIVSSCQRKKTSFSEEIEALYDRQFDWIVLSSRLINLSIYLTFERWGHFPTQKCTHQFLFKRSVLSLLSDFVLRFFKNNFPTHKNG